jgi:hypothetical protein
MGKRKLPDWIEAYLAYVDNSEPPIIYKKWAAVSAIAACIQRKCCLSWGHGNFYPNMYIVLVSQSGKCRKGTAMGPVAAMLRKLGVPLSAESVTREALIQDLSLNSQSTSCGEGKLMNHCSLTVFSEELTVFLGYNNMTLMADLCNWFDCPENWKYKTKGKGEDILYNIWFNLFGATTPELLQTTLPRDAIGGGLTSRIIFVYEDKKSKIVPVPVLSADEKLIGQALHADLELINMQTGEFRITEDFLTDYSKWYIAQQKNPPFADPIFGGYCERRQVHALKLSMIMNVSRGDGEMILEAVDFKRAVDLLEETEKKMERAFSGVGKSSVADVTAAVMQMIAQQKKVTLSFLLNAFYRDIDKDTLMKILETLRSMGFCRLLTNGGDMKIEYVDKSERAKLEEKKESA